MRALTLTAVKTPLSLEERDDLVPGPGQVVVEIRAAALNRRDYWITQGMYPGIHPPVVLGSDASGTIKQCGPDVESVQAGDEVIINPGRNWGSSPAAQSSAFTILGVPDDGTFATEVLVDAIQIHKKPSHLDWNESAAIPLAGVTAWRALFTQGELQSGQNVLITGIGGGVATFALQFAVAAGARVWVTSSSEDKIRKAVELGASGGCLYTDETWTKKLLAESSPPDLIIDSAGGNGYRDLVELAAPGGRIVNYGATTGPPPKLDLFKVFWKQLQLRGSTMGSPEDFTGMLNFLQEHQLKPSIEQVFALSDGNAAIEAMASSPQFGKYILVPERSHSTFK